ncbi:erythromycin esterase family protein [Rubrivirga sp.]|uniref:erythromycin esterase family protein n=1 Tax=Rubrivirga sp. TaxID=1885344 RepID=UPI003B51F702
MPLRSSLLAVAALAALFPLPTTAQDRASEPPPEVVDWIRAHAVPLAGADPALPDDDLDALDALLGDAQVIGLGEGTHGTSEFFAFRDRVVRWLARRGELDAVLWEAEFVQSLDREPALNDPSVPVAEVGLFNNVWVTDENEALLAFVRAHNQSAGTPVRFVGVDAFDLPRSVVAALDAAGRVGGEATEAVAVMAEAFGTDPSQTCADPRACWRALFGMSPGRARQFAEGAAWLADALDGEPDEWTGAVAARIAERSTRHRLQFALMELPLRTDARSLADLEGHVSAVAAGVRRAADTLSAALGTRDPAWWAGVEPVVTALPGGLDAYRDSLNPAERYAWDEAVRGVRARVATGRYGDDGALLAAADTLVLHLDLLHESLRTPPTHMDFDNEREVAIGLTLPAVARRLGRGGRMVFGAHNGHVGYNPSITLARKSSGAFVRDGLGDDYLAVGTFFGEGSFQAYDTRSRADDWPGPPYRAFTLGPPAPGSFEAALWATGLDAFALDLRELPASGPVAEWFRTPRPARNIGNSYDPDRPDDFVEETVVADGFDAVVFFRETTRAMPTAEALARGYHDLSPK